MRDVLALPADLGTAGWEPVDQGRAIAKTYSFDSFPEAMAFMLRVSYDAEKADHHPEWSNVYNRVEVRMTTHDAGGLTEKDFTLARAMEGAASVLLKKPTPGRSEP